jgi:hypothetical protein
MRRSRPLALFVGLALALSVPSLRAQDEPKPDAPEDSPGKTGDGSAGEDAPEPPEPPESPNLKLPPNASATLTKAIEAFKAAYKRVYKEGYEKAKADLQEAVKLLRRAREEDMTSPLPLYYLGILNQLEGDDKHAVENLNVVVRLNPKFWEAWTELGDAHAHLGDHKEAETAYAKALEIKPDHLEAWRGRSLERLEDGRFAEAVDDAKKGLAIAPKDAWCRAVLVRAKLAADGPSWKNTFTKETDHYIVKTDVDQPFAEWLASQAELIRKLYVKIFEKCHLELPKRKYTIFVFANKAEYHEAGGPAGAGGHYDPIVRQLFLFKYPQDSDTQLVLFHEGFHQFLHPYLPRAPQWFNEGLGDYFGAAKYVKTPVEGMLIRPNTWRLGEIKAGIAAGQVKPLKVLLNLSQAELYDKKSVSMNYAQSWSFIYFLCEYQNRRYFPLLGKYFSALRGGKSQDEAYKTAFGDQDMDRIDHEWRAFVLSLS